MAENHRVTCRGGYLSEHQKDFASRTTDDDFIEAMFQWWIDGRNWDEFISDYTHPKLFDK